MRMIYIVGGASRSGKSLLAMKLCHEKLVPYFSLDVLRYAVARSGAMPGIDTSHNDLDDGDKMWPLIRELIGNLAYYEQPYLIEGTLLRTQHVIEACELFPRKIKSCFLVQAMKGVQDKERDEFAFPTTNNYVREMTKADRLRHLEWCIQRSQEVAAECAALGLPCFDTGPEFTTALDQAAAYLVP
jgi:hypothetical protein